MNNIAFRIAKSSDDKIIRAMEEISRTAEFNLNRITLTPAYGGAIVLDPNSLNNNATVNAIRESKSEIFQNFNFQYSEGPFAIVIIRTAGQTSDEIKLNISPLGEEYTPNVIKLYSGLRRKLKAIDSEIAIKALVTEDLGRYYDKREAELTKLEEISETIIYKNEQFIERKEDEYSNRQKELEQKFLEKQSQLVKEFDEKLLDLKKREESLDVKLKEIDDRESKHVRRKIREDLKTELKNRSQTFELTKGTRNLRTPIFYFILFLLAFFGVGLILYSYYSIKSIIDQPQNTIILVSMIIKQLTFAVAFGSTSVFFIRWNNKWFEQHANEEFRLKRHELDLDRASWLVEMALEWKNEKGTEIPKEMIDRLSRNLFAEPKEDKTELHPADQLASALFGAASNIRLKGPNGTEASFDRKSINNLQKQPNVFE